MAFEAQGKLHKIFDTANVTDSFRKREFVLEILDGAYTEYIKFQLIQDRCNLLDAFKEGAEVKVSFNLKGKPYTGRSGETIYFTNLDAWRVESAQESGKQKGSDPDDFPSASDIPPVFDSSNDGLPF